MLEAGGDGGQGEGFKRKQTMEARYHVTDARSRVCLENR